MVRERGSAPARQGAAWVLVPASDPRALQSVWEPQEASPVLLPPLFGPFFPSLLNLFQPPFPSGFLFAPFSFLSACQPAYLPLLLPLIFPLSRLFFLFPFPAPSTPLIFLLLSPFCLLLSFLSCVCVSVSYALASFYSPSSWSSSLFPFSPLLLLLFFLLFIIQAWQEVTWGWLE